MNDEKDRKYADDDRKCGEAQEVPELLHKTPQNFKTILWIRPMQKMHDCNVKTRLSGRALRARVAFQPQTPFNIWR